MLAKLQALGVQATFSRPRVSDDNPYSEALFRTLKYRPNFPSKPFESLEAARTWVRAFARWYNDEHLHSAIRFVTTSSRHEGDDIPILSQRRAVYEKARRLKGTRWARGIRDFGYIDSVTLHPENTEERVTQTA